MARARKVLKLLKKSRQVFVILVGFKLILIFIIAFLCLREVDEHGTFDNFHRSHFELSNIGIKEYPVATNYERWDWNNYDFMKYESEREGIGEQGEGHKLTDSEDIELDTKLEEVEGLHVIVSDQISVNRSVRDTRPEVCKSKKYFKELPSTSIVVIFFDEWPSVLLRTIHSIYNRTPRELLKELILVNDCSTKPELNDEFEVYVRENFDDRVQILRLNERKGLIVARMEGAKLATGQVLLFLDSHVEVNVNWLPPLLEPIAINPKTVSTPTIDKMDPVTFKYIKLPGVRGFLDEFMWYQWFNLHPHDKKNPNQPHRIPIMLGCAFAIRRDFFYDLGEHDEGLQIWNGEQIELSLKLHLCGGDLVEVPCSRVAHTFRSNQKHHLLSDFDVSARNFKRIAEVWFDDYKEVVYNADPERFDVDPGDLTKAKLVKEKLMCKPFQYFLENIEPEMYTRYYYQLDYPGYFAWGAIRSDAYPKYCVDFMHELRKPIQIYECNSIDIGNPDSSQFWKLTWHRKLRLWFKDDCLQQNIAVDFCKYDKDRKYQEWKYNWKTKQIISFWRDKWCLTAAMSNTSLFLSECNSSNINQKWTWGNVNEAALKGFDKIYWEDNKVVGLNEH